MWGNPNNVYSLVHKIVQSSTWYIDDTMAEEHVGTLCTRSTTLL